MRQEIVNGCGCICGNLSGYSGDSGVVGTVNTDPCGLFARRGTVRFIGWPNPYPTDDGVPWRNDYPYPIQWDDSCGGWVTPFPILSGPQKHFFAGLNTDIIASAYVSISLCSVTLCRTISDRGGPIATCCCGQITGGGYWYTTLNGPIDLACIGGYLRYIACTVEGEPQWDCSTGPGDEYSCNVTTLPNAGEVPFQPIPPPIFFAHRRFIWKGNSDPSGCPTPFGDGREIHFDL
jgi:hypothetical protein